MPWSRRQAMKLGIAGGLVLAVGSVGVGLQSSVLQVPAAALVALNAQTYSILWAFAERVHPGARGFPKASEVQVALKVDALLGMADAGFATDVGRALLVFENAAVHLATLGVPRPFTACDSRTQDRIIADWMNSRVALRRTIYSSLRGLCTASYYASPELWPFVGYPGPRTGAVPE